MPRLLPGGGLWSWNVWPVVDDPKESPPRDLKGLAEAKREGVPVVA